MGGGRRLPLGGSGGPPQEILKILIQFGALWRNLGALLCKKKQPLKRRSAVVRQFETCGTEIHPEFIQNFLPCFDVSIFPSCGFRCLAFTVPLRRMTDLASEQTVLCFTSVRQSMLF